MLALGCGLFFIFFSYSGGFTREGLWIFFTLGILSCLLALSFIVRTCIAIQPKKEKKPEDERKEKKDTRLALALKVVIARYNDFTDVNGKYYLTKMYAAEAFEHTQQVYSLTKIYLCLMPVEISTIVCAVLTVELIINIWATFHIGSQEMRDRLILLAIFTDIFCLAFPLSYSRFVLGMPIRLESMLFIMATNIIVIKIK